MVVLLAAAASGLGDIWVFQLFKRRLSHTWTAAVGPFDPFGRTLCYGQAGRSTTYGPIYGIRFIPADGLATPAAAGIANVSTRGFSLCVALGGILGGLVLRSGLCHWRSHRTAVLGESLIGVGVGLRSAASWV